MAAKETTEILRTEGSLRHGGQETDNMSAEGSQYQVGPLQSPMILNLMGSNVCDLSFPIVKRLGSLNSL